MQVSGRFPACVAHPSPALQALPPQQIWLEPPQDVHTPAPVAPTHANPAPQAFAAQHG